MLKIVGPLPKNTLCKKISRRRILFFISSSTFIRRSAGKSLFVDTLRCAFARRKKLFEGLYLENNWNWEEKYPVVRFSFDGGKVENKEEMKRYIKSIIKFWSKNYEVEIEEELYYSMLSELIYKINEKSGKKVMLLIDEYDKPILDNIEKSGITGEGAPSPEFLVKVMGKTGYYIPNLKEILISPDLLNWFDVDNMLVEALLYQTGYLTVKREEEKEDGERELVLSYPNKEVRRSLNLYIGSRINPNTYRWVR